MPIDRIAMQRELDRKEALRISAEEREREAAAAVPIAVASFRARIGAILRGPAGLADFAGAVALALDTDMSAVACARLYGGHGGGAAAPEPLPAPLGPTAQAAISSERSRIGAILRAPEAQDRREAALGLALDSSITPQQARSLLEKLPKAVDRMASIYEKTGGRYMPIEERSKETGEFGASGDMERPSKGGDAWSKAVSELNKEAVAGRSPSRPAEPDFTSETFASDRRT